MRWIARVESASGLAGSSVLGNGYRELGYCRPQTDTLFNYDLRTSTGKEQRHPVNCALQLRGHDARDVRGTRRDLEDADSIDKVTLGTTRPIARQGARTPDGSLPGSGKLRGIGARLVERLEKVIAPWTRLAGPHDVGWFRGDAEETSLGKCTFSFREPRAR